MNPRFSPDLDSLCRAYGYPAYAFIRRRGVPHHEAEDLTRGFFTEFRRTGGIGCANSEPGRLRTLLLAALLHHLEDPGRSDRAAPRGAGTPPALDLQGADVRFDRESIDTDLTPEEAFDHDWSMITIERAIAELRTEYAPSRGGALVEALGPFVWGGSVPPPKAEAAAALGMTEHALAATVHRLRHRLREHLRTLVATTVEDPANVDGELRFLLAVVHRRPVAA